MTFYPIPWEKAGKTLTAVRQLGRIQNCLRLNLQICLFNGITEPRHATLTSHPRRTHIAPIYCLAFRVSSFEYPSKTAPRLTPRPKNRDPRLLFCLHITLSLAIYTFSFQRFT